VRKVPKTMATQHPDNAGEAFWLGQSFISSKEEVKECLISFLELGCEEFMWDWEGKYVDEAVIERLFEENFSFFKKKLLGRDIFLTYRIPNIWIERGSYRILRAFANIFTAHDITKNLGINFSPVFEVILPMTTRAEQLVYLQRKFVELANLLKKDIQAKIGSGDPRIIEIIPLIEDIPYFQTIDKMLEKYLLLYSKRKLTKVKKIEYLRPFIARSDPALNYGLIPAVLGAKIALSKLYQVGSKLDIKVYPIIGCGSVPFRGHLSPENIKNFIREYSGIRTVTIQSSFRYDWSLDKVKKSIGVLNLNLNSSPAIISEKEREEIEEIITIFKTFYRHNIAKIVDLINTFSRYVPRRRERRLHVGLFGYSREFSKGIHLPRAITFTASLYSLGIPPEIIGVGRALKVVEKRGLREILEKHYLNIKWDLETAAGFINRENIHRLKKKYPSLENIEEDLKLLERILKVPTQPSKTYELIHKNLTSNILLLLEAKRDVTSLIEETGRLRKFLG
jgi:phosphoenolpyruvate carboxylase